MSAVKAALFVFLFCSLTPLLKAQHEEIVADYIALHYEIEDKVLENQTLLHAHVNHVVENLAMKGKLVTAGRFAERYKDLFALLKNITISELVDFVTADPVYLSGGMINWTHTPYGVIYPQPEPDGQETTCSS